MLSKPFYLLSPSANEAGILSMLGYHFPKVGKRHAIRFTDSPNYNGLTYAVDHYYSIPTPCKLDRIDALYQRNGFKRDDIANFSPQFGVDKIAVWINKKGEVTHAAKQNYEVHPARGNKQWKSKLGYWHIIFHNIKDLNGEICGKATHTYSKNWLSRTPNFGLNLFRTYYMGGSNNPLPKQSPKRWTLTLAGFLPRIIKK
jgi:hypothetical protein